jgi:HSP20 family protein
MSSGHPSEEEEQSMALPVLTRPRPAERWEPLRELDDVYDRLAALWESGPFGAADRWVPLADLEETDDAWTVELELPGVARDDVDVELDEGMLTVSGEVKEKERTGILRRRTRRVGRYRYTVTLPGDVDADSVDARLHDGVLTVRVPKSPETKRRRIAITS